MTSTAFIILILPPLRLSGLERLVIFSVPVCNLKKFKRKLKFTNNVFCLLITTKLFKQYLVVFSSFIRILNKYNKLIVRIINDGLNVGIGFKKLKLDITYVKFLREDKFCIREQQN